MAASSHFGCYRSRQSAALLDQGRGDTAAATAGTSGNVTEAPPSGVKFLAAKIIEGAGCFRPSMNDSADLLISIATARHEVIRLLVWDENDPRCRSDLADELIPSRDTTRGTRRDRVSEYLYPVREWVAAAAEECRPSDSRHCMSCFRHRKEGYCEVVGTSKSGLDRPSMATPHGVLYEDRTSSCAWFHRGSAKRFDLMVGWV